MNEYEISIVPVIEANYDRLTQVEKNIADFFIANTENMDFSAKNLAEKRIADAKKLKQ